MSRHFSLDSIVRMRLRQWPQCPPGLEQRRSTKDGWLRGRPVEKTDHCLPFLKLPGSDRLRTLPDGLWLNFGLEGMGWQDEDFAAVIAWSSARRARP